MKPFNLKEYQAANVAEGHGMKIRHICGWVYFKQKNRWYGVRSSERVLWSSYHKHELMWNLEWIRYNGDPSNITAKREDL